jgi:hypothetical protein
LLKLIYPCSHFSHYFHQSLFRFVCASLWKEKCLGYIWRFSLSLFAAPLLPNEELGALTLATSSSTVFFRGDKIYPRAYTITMRIIICGLEKDAAAVEQPRSFFGGDRRAAVRRGL